MRNLVRCVSPLLVLVSVTALATSCATAAPPTAAAPTATTAPSPVATATPTSEVVATPTSVPTETPAAAPTPTPEIVGTPSSPDEVPRISVEELKALMDSGANVVILDNRPQESYQLGHIKGAISFPWKTALTMADAELLPWGRPIITYCDCGPGEADSADVAFQLMQLGLEDLKVLIHPAIEGWIEAGYPTE